MAKKCACGTDVFDRPDLSKLSQLENDMGFIVDQGYVHTDNNYTDEDKDIVHGAGSIPALVEQAEQAIADANIALNTANEAIVETQQATNDANQAAQNASEVVDEANAAIVTITEAVTAAHTAVENAEQAVSDAQEAITNANQATQEASDIAVIAQTAANNADSKATLADTAASNASTAAGNASAAAIAANTATDNTIIATGNANTATSNANTATNNANLAATAANNKVTELTELQTDLNTLKSETESNLALSTTAISNANTATSNANQAANAANQAAENVQDGKTPIIGDIDATSVPNDQPASFSLTQTSTDPNGNPIYTGTAEFPIGATGKDPVLEAGTTTTGNPGTNAIVTIVQDGVTEDGNPKYLVNFTIPRGAPGQDGSGSGNVYINNEGTSVASTNYVLESAETGSATFELAEVATVATTGSYSDLGGIPSTFTPSAHTHNVTDINTLQSLLDGKGTKLNIQQNSIPVRTLSGTGEPDTYIIFSATSTTGSTVAIRNANGTLRAANPVDSTDLVTLQSLLAVNNLTNYYLQSQTYTKTEVNNLIGAISTVSISIQSSLPETGSSNVIYFIPKTESTNNVYDEYAWINNAWELIGSTDVDLSNYYDKQDVDTLLASKVSVVAGKDLSTNDYTNDEKDKLLNIQAGAQVNPGVATTTVNGLMSSADKTSFNSINASWVWHTTYYENAPSPTTTVNCSNGGCQLANIATTGSFSFTNLDSIPVGGELMLRVNASTTAYTLTLPATSGTFKNEVGSTVQMPANGVWEFNVKHFGTQYIMKGVSYGS